MSLSEVNTNARTVSAGDFGVTAVAGAPPGAAAAPVLAFPFGQPCSAAWKAFACSSFMPGLGGRASTPPSDPSSSASSGLMLDSASTPSSLMVACSSVSFALLKTQYRVSSASLGNSGSIIGANFFLESSIAFFVFSASPP